MGIFRMVKWALGLMFLLGMLVVAAVIGYFQLDRMVKAAIERGGGYALGTPTHLESATLKALRGELAFNRLRVENPPGFTDPLFIEVEQGEIALDARTLLSRRVEMPRIQLDGLTLNLEHSSEGANYEAILANLEDFKDSFPRGRTGEKSYVIDEIVIRDITVNAATRRLAFLRPLRVSIDEIVLVDVRSTSPDGLVLGQVKGLILDAILRAILEEAGSIFSPGVAASLSGDPGPRTTVRGVQVEGLGTDGLIDATRRGLDSLLRGNPRQSE